MICLPGLYTSTAWPTLDRMLLECYRMIGGGATLERRACLALRNGRSQGRRRRHSALSRAHSALSRAHSALASPTSLPPSKLKVGVVDKSLRDACTALYACILRTTTKVWRMERLFPARVTV